MSVSLYQKRKYGRRPTRVIPRYPGAYAQYRSIARPNLLTRRMRPRPYAARVARVITPAMNRQLKGLIAAKHRDGADVARISVALTATRAACLTSSTAFDTAASGTGLLDMDGDEALINSVRLCGIIANNAGLVLNQINVVDTLVRYLVVWFNKPLRVADANGTLPPITEVLMTDAISSLPVNAASNGGRFVILSDRLFNMGINLHQATTADGYVRNSGSSLQKYDYTVKVDKRVKFVANASAGASAGGTYDSDITAGRVSSGLLVLYIQTVYYGAGCDLSCHTRLNYTG